MDFTTIKYPSHNDLVQWYYQLAQRISENTGVTTDQVNVLIESYIAEHPYPVVPEDIITKTNAATNVVTSVNGKKGDVTVIGGGDISDNIVTTDNIGQNAVTSFNGKKGAVTGVASVNGKTGAVTVSESPANVITSDNIARNAVTSFNGKKGAVTGVASVNGKTGAVTVSESPANVITSDNIARNAVTSFNGKVGRVTGVTSFNGKNGDISYPYEPIYRAWDGFLLPLVPGSRALAFCVADATFSGIDITYNITFDGSLFSQISTVYACTPVYNDQAVIAVQGVKVSNALNVKIKVEDFRIVGPDYETVKFYLIMLVTLNGGLNV